jgi:uncharacterized membrane protein (UPF0127 family)
MPMTMTMTTTTMMIMMIWLEVDGWIHDGAELRPFGSPPKRLSPGPTRNDFYYTIPLEEFASPFSRTN